MTVIMDPDCTAGKHSNCDGTGWDEDTEALADCPCPCHEPIAANEPSDAEIAAFKDAWRDAGVKIGRGIAAPGTKTRAGLSAAYAARGTAPAGAILASSAKQRGQGICRTCLAPIWNEGGTVGHQERDTGWSDRIRQGGDSLVCFKALHYRHVPLEGREAAIYDVALMRTTKEAS